MENVFLPAGVFELAFDPDRAADGVMGAGMPGLSGHAGGVLGAGGKLHMEKHGLYGGAVAGRTYGDPQRAFGGGKGGRRREMEKPVVHRTAKPEGEPLYHCDLVIFKLV